jgi:biotin carboxylase
MTSRVLIIAPHGSYRTSAFIAAAHDLKLDVLIASEGKHSIVSEYAQGLHIHFQDEDASLKLILQEAKNTPFKAIIGTDDSSTELAAKASAALNLSHNPLSAVTFGRRKDLARQCLAQHAVPVPNFRLINLELALEPQLAAIGYPVVVKPVALSASRGVIRANDQTELIQAIHRVKALLENEGDLPHEVKHTLLVETFIAGDEVAVEGMLHNGVLEILSVFDKPDPLDGPYFEETYYITPSRHNKETLDQLHQVVADACSAYGLREGPIHAECRINDSGIWILEVAARTIGGLCGRLLQFGTGYSLEELVLARAMGKPLSSEPEQAKVAAGVLMIPTPEAGILKRVEGQFAASQIDYIESVEIQIREGYELIPLPEGANYLGFIFARAPSAELAEAALRKAHACLNIVIAPLWKIQGNVFAAS